jgi:hypothetical protein
MRLLRVLAPPSAGFGREGESADEENRTRAFA